MNISTFKRPEDIKPDEKMVPISARVRESLQAELKKMANANGYPLAKLVEEVLEDYVKWVGKTSNKKRKKS